jgi:hypothetical protein
MNSKGILHNRMYFVWVVAALVASSSGGCGRAMIEEEESRMAIDALYTAVTSRRAPLVETCEKQLRELESAGKLPAASARELDRVIAQARQDQWQPAAERLDRLIRRSAQ